MGWLRTKIPPGLPGGPCNQQTGKCAWSFCLLSRISTGNTAKLCRHKNQYFISAVMKVSQAAAELQQYCMQNACKDALLVGVPAGSNPFREPRSCALL
uniref:Guanine nucleotide-binding protein subunit gamma n=1 Tax=Otus sunia TaxID=257818 RepID=A0A8C8E9Z9_9STRI